MSISVRFFASIREKVGKGEARVELPGGATAAEIWAQVTTIPMPPNTLVAINQEYAQAGQPVRDGDEVAFFPPVTGGGR